MTEEMRLPSLEPLSEQQASEMMIRLRRRQAASARAATLVSERQARSEPSLPEDADVREQLALAKLLHDAGKFTEAEYLFHSAFQVGRIHTKRWFAALYEPELSPFSAAIEAIERDHGLAEDESFHIDSGPEEWRALNARYGAVLDEKFGEILLEFGLDDLAELWNRDREQFDQLREAGRIALLEQSDSEATVLNRVKVCEREARLCAAAAAWSAAATMVASAAEARLILHCLRRPDAARAAVGRLTGQLRPSGNDPLNWRCEQLVAVARAGGWLYNLQHKEIVGAMSDWLERLRAIQHPLRPSGPGRDRPAFPLGEAEFEEARSAYAALRRSLDFAVKAAEHSETLQ